MLHHIQLDSGDAMEGETIVENGSIMVTSLHLVVGDATIITIQDVPEGEEGASTIMGPYPIPAGNMPFVLPLNMEDGHGLSSKGLQIVSSAAVTVAGAIGFRRR